MKFNQNTTRPAPPSDNEAKPSGLDRFKFNLSRNADAASIADAEDLMNRQTRGVVPEDADFEGLMGGVKSVGLAQIFKVTQTGRASKRLDWYYASPKVQARRRALMKRRERQKRVAKEVGGTENAEMEGGEVEETGHVVTKSGEAQNTEHAGSEGGEEMKTGDAMMGDGGS